MIARRAAWWMWLALACALGCAGAKPKPEAALPPKPPENPWSWLPEQATTIGRAELRDLRNSQLWALWGELERTQHIASWVDLAKVDVITFAGSGQNREDASYVAALEGAFSQAELRALAQRDGVAPETHGLLTVYRRPDSVWTQITPKLIVTSSPDRAEALIARASAGPATAIKEGALYRSLAERVELERVDAALLADDPDGSRRASVERTAARYGLGAIARDSQRLGFGLEVGAEYRLVAVAEAPDGTRAQALEADVRDKLDALSSNFLVRILGLGKAIASLRAASDGNYVIVRGALPEEELAQLIQRTQGALSVTSGLGGRALGSE